jgi:hypothetical protein
VTNQQIFDRVQKRTYFSRPDDEIWAAISGWAKYMYNEILAENRGWFIKWDTTFLTIAATQEDYPLPLDLEQIIRLRERVPGATNAYRTIMPADINSRDFIDAQFNSIVGADQDGPVSDFVYFGPYLQETDAQTAVKQYHMRLAPIPQDSRQTELVYVAKFLEVTSVDDILVIPDEGHEALIAYASADLKQLNDDSSAATELTAAEMHDRQFLKLVRNRQMQKGRQVEQYIDDMD